MTTEDILQALQGLEKPDFTVHMSEDAWYSERAIDRCFGVNGWEDKPAIKTVRVLLPSGVLELHEMDDKINIKCYCCFNNPPDIDRGTFALSELKDAVEALRNHCCPPWPG